MTFANFVGLCLGVMVVSILVWDLIAARRRQVRALARMRNQNRRGN